MQGMNREKTLRAEIADLKKDLKEKEKLCKEQNDAHSKAIENSDRNEKMLHSLVEAAAGKIGQDFFDNIVARLAEWLDADCVLIGRMTEDERINAVPLYLDGNISHDFSYALKDSPCDITTRKGYCAYSENVIELFPKDEILVDLNAEAYIGTALYNEEGIANGVICAVSRKKLEIPPYATDIMKIIGARVTAEIERKKIEEALTKSEAELRESNATKDKFFSIVAHDLKNPLSTIISYSELLLTNFDKYDAEKNKKYIGTMNQGTKNIMALLENLLTWSRSQRGIMEFSPDIIKLQPLAEDTIDLVREMANEKHISLQLDIDNDIFVRVDKNMLSTILRNLISNAVKFTKSGGNVIVSSHILRDKTKEQIQISVEDNGLGIESENLKNIFKIDKNFSSLGTNNEKGTGLGLVLCKEFVEKNGGRIHVESKLGRGSRFIFTLNVA